MTQVAESNLETVALFTMLKDHGASHVVVVFSGSGDSGEYTEMHAVPQSIVGDDGNLTESTWSSEFNNAVKPMKDIPAENRDLIENLVEGNTNAHDWWNNEGGDGYIVINMTDMTFYVHYAINRNEVDEHHTNGTITV